MRIMFQGWFSFCMLLCRREPLNEQIQHAKVVMDHRIAIADAITERTRKAKVKKVTVDRRRWISDMVFEAAHAARNADWKTFYHKMRRLKRGKRRAPPMLKGKDGQYILLPEAVAQRWVDFF